MDRAPRIDRIDALIAVAFVAAIATWAVLAQRPPDAVAADAPADRFSAERAMVHVRAIASEPHPMGSAGAEKVRRYLARELSGMGIEPSIVRGSSMPGRSVYGRIPGKTAGKAVLLSAHYDSVPDGPGAGDNAAGVAAVLEAVRALTAKGEPRLDNDVMILFTDGEEQGFGGARAFAEDAERRSLVGLVLNFDARGSRGPSFLFETSERNGWMIREFARAAPYPMASSLAGAIYRLMPNSTDLSMYRAMGLKGLNFAFVDGVENYHRPTDTAANLDKRSVQHQGSYALALARHFGDRDLALAASEPDAVYFNTIGARMVVYPGSWTLPLTIAAVVAFGAVVGIGRRRGRLTDAGLLMGIGLGLVALLLATGGAWSVWYQLKAGRPPTGPKGYQGSTETAALLAFIGIMGALCVYIPALKRLRADDLAMGGLFWWLAATVGTSLFLPGGSYLFLWPLLFGLFGIGIAVASPRPGSLPVRAASYLAAVPALVLLPPTIHAISVALGPTRPYVTAPLAAMLMLALLPMLTRMAAAFGARPAA